MFGREGSPFLKIGTIVEESQEQGIRPELLIRVKRLERKGDHHVGLLSRSSGKIPSGPGAFRGFKERISSMISSGATGGQDGRLGGGVGLVRVEQEEAKVVEKYSVQAEAVMGVGEQGTAEGDV